MFILNFFYIIKQNYNLYTFPTDFNLSDHVCRIWLIVTEVDMVKNQQKSLLPVVSVIKK